MIFSRKHIRSFFLFSIYLATTTIASAQQVPRVLLIVDGSGSMWGKIGSQYKIELAKDAIGTLVDDLPDNVAVGLQFYGHRKKGDCGDIELKVPLGTNNRAAIATEIKNLNPKGKTPLTRSLLQAADLVAADEEATTIVLISDGKESCDADPCSAVRAMKDKGLNFQAHVIGFDVQFDEREQLICIANEGGGTYYTANNAQQLASSFHRIGVSVKADKCQTRNPFCVADVPEPFDANVQQYAASAAFPELAAHPNAAAWTGSGAGEPLMNLDGYWRARWNGGSAKDEWISGTATVRTVGDIVYILYTDRTSTYLTEARKDEGGRLVGKYVDLSDPSDTTPWVGRVVNNHRIDGNWGEGRWDYKR